MRAISISFSGSRVGGFLGSTFSSFFSFSFSSFFPSPSPLSFASSFLLSFSSSTGGITAAAVSSAVGVGKCASTPMRDDLSVDCTGAYTVDAAVSAATIFDGLSLPALRSGPTKRSACDMRRGSRDETKRSISMNAACKSAEHNARAQHHELSGPRHARG